jgi:hypothetical protein
VFDRIRDFSSRVLAGSRDKSRRFRLQGDAIFLSLLCAISWVSKSSD